jgi:pimeloyl-ACP methyl ester carboxylesterase
MSRGARHERRGIPPAKAVRYPAGILTWRMYAKRAHSHTIEVEGASHLVYESHPKEVAALIEDAASHALLQGRATQDRSQ